MSKLVQNMNDIWSQKICSQANVMKSTRSIWKFYISAQLNNETLQWIYFHNVQPNAFFNHYLMHTDYKLRAKELPINGALKWWQTFNSAYICLEICFWRWLDSVSVWRSFGLIYSTIHATGRWWSLGLEKQRKCSHSIGILVTTTTCTSFGHVLNWIMCSHIKCYFFNLDNNCWACWVSGINRPATGHSPHKLVTSSKVFMIDTP